MSMTDTREILKSSQDVPEPKRPKREYLAFRGHRQPRVGQDFQVVTLPSPPANADTVGDSTTTLEHEDIEEKKSDASN